jgi:hypothetical protein
MDRYETTRRHIPEEINLYITGITLYILPILCYAMAYAVVKATLNKLRKYCVIDKGDPT